MLFRRFLLILQLLPFITFSQEVLWANKVVGFSSERTDFNAGPQYRAIQALGKPNKLPQKGESVCAWSPAGSDTFGEEWIKVSFAKPLKIKQVAIAENLGAGAITKIFATDSTDKEYLISENKEPPIKEVGRMWNVIIPQTAFEVYAIKIVLEPNKVKGYNEIDAIAISDSDFPIETKINVSTNMPKEIIKENLGKTVNSRSLDTAPVITPDGKILYFTRANHPNNIGKAREQDIWFSRLQPDGTWGEAENLLDLNDEYPNAVSTISADGKKLYVLNVYSPDGTIRKGLSYSTKNKNAGWNKQKEVKIKNYYSNSATNEFSISSNGKVLIYSAQRDDSKGGKDLYVSFRGEDDVWSKPQNLGSVINTAANEGSPTLASDSKTLYFTSEGHQGYGDGDIFLTKRLDSTWTNWSEPENLGPLINTPKWDGYLTIPASGDYAYMASEFNSIGADDIFRFKLFPSIKPEPVAIISGVVVNALDKKPISADILMEAISDTIAHEKMSAEFDPETGEYKIIVPLKKTYSLIATKKGFLGLSETIDLSKDSKFREIRKNINLVPIKEGTTIILHNLFFEQSKFDILPASFPELNRIIELMKEYPTMEVLLEGHTDNQGDLMLNLKLSEDRVVEVKKYLVQFGGINEKRIQLKGWGQSHPIGSNVTDETRKKNRRVEFTIIKL